MTKEEYNSQLVDVAEALNETGIGWVATRKNAEIHEGRGIRVELYHATDEFDPRGVEAMKVSNGAWGDAVLTLTDPIGPSTLLAMLLLD